MTNIPLNKANMYIPYSESALKLFHEIIRRIEALGYTKYTESDEIGDFIPGSSLILDSDKDWYISSTHNTLLKDNYNEISYKIFVFEDVPMTKPVVAPAMKFVKSIKSNI